MKTEVKSLLESVRDGTLSVEEALLRLKVAPYEDIGFAKVDLHRGIRQGVPEVIYGEGKSSEQITGIIETMLRNGQERILITRLPAETAQVLASRFPLQYHESPRLGVIGLLPEPDGIGPIVIATGGTSDIPVAEEARLTAYLWGNAVDTCYDCGVAGIHRLFAHIDEITSANVLIVVAGMEGALASVVGGLTARPVIAVPTSVGYGASFNGLAALLAMLNSCAAGVSVVNIDNGFGAGVLAAKINRVR